MLANSCTNESKYAGYASGSVDDVFDIRETMEGGKKVIEFIVNDKAHFTAETGTIFNTIYRVTRIKPAEPTGAQIVIPGAGVVAKKIESLADAVALALGHAAAQLAAIKDKAEQSDAISKLAAALESLMGGQSGRPLAVLTTKPGSVFVPITGGDEARGERSRTIPALELSSTPRWQLYTEIEKVSSEEKYKLMGMIHAETIRKGDVLYVKPGATKPVPVDIERVEALIADLGLREQVVFTGSQPREILWVILQNAKLAVCPTLFEGGGSGPAVEAVVAKIPLACARIPQVLEQFDSRVDFCDWFDPSNEDAIADCVRTLMANYDAAIDRATRAGRIFPDIRSWAEVAGTYWGALENAAR